ncbi:hypothetical protein TSTA_080360 [Talaromyces stipitatus ATCC 10500]|uniref:Ankyrin repeat-containing protein n=1 Tax=Talaromyces stipitatus (strain ATCC 10500 / CBS 375.48 / QM 6759 / NRRL 1006) TaxID=441959 RepID=B8MVJ5_TALSN|nr:uncharacterized protein TSTA_080360 [Talaromyces stipitatus ATCC 10500]EED11422.1 hypothetical protein TSTA_080360 [Talaromyces stipitatus ATCC 10500]
MSYIKQEDLIEAARVLRNGHARVVPNSLVLPEPKKAVADTSKDGYDKGDGILGILRNIWTLPGSWRNADGYTMLTLLMSKGVTVEWNQSVKYYLTKMAHGDCFGAGAHTHNWSKGGHTPLHFAVESNDCKYAEVLEGFEDALNFDGITALHHAILLGKKEIIEKLLSAPHPIDKRRVVLSAILTNREGKSALQLARDKKLQNVVETIEKYAGEFRDCAFVLDQFSIDRVQNAITDGGVDLFRHYVYRWPNDCLGWREKETENTILQWMLRNTHNIHDIMFDSTPYYMAMILLDVASQEPYKEKHGGFLNYTNKKKETAEHIAIKTGQYEYLDLFHSRGSNIYAKDNMGNNALYCFLSTENGLYDGGDAPYLDSILCLDRYYLGNPGKIAGSCIEPKDGDLINGSDDKYALELVLTKYNDANADVNANVNADADNNDDDDDGARVAKMLVQMWPEFLTKLPKAKYKELWEAQKLTEKKLKKVLYTVGEIFVGNQDKNLAVELLDHPVLPSLGLKNYTNSPLHWFVKDYNTYMGEEENFLLSFKDVDMNSTDFYGKNIIFYAVEYRAFELLKLVINLGASVGPDDISRASEKQDFEMVEFLIRELAKESKIEIGKGSV